MEISLEKKCALQNILFLKYIPLCFVQTILPFFVDLQTFLLSSISLYFLLLLGQDNQFPVCVRQNRGPLCSSGATEEQV